MASTRIDDDLRLGRLLTRREALALIGASGVVLLAGAAPGRAQAPSTAAARPSCVARPQQTEGPFFVEEALNRSDIRSDPRSGESRPGVPLRLTFNVSRLSGAGCGPLAGAQVDVWHCDAAGRYSDVRGSATGGQQFLRGYQIADATGSVQFLTIYPGCYGGRAVHVHFKIRAGPAAARSYAFTSQLYFDEALTERVYAAEPYASQSQRWMRNASDGIFRGGGRQLLLAPEPEGHGYAAMFDIGLQV
ncbi:MAG: twin-arginine translocation pathway signal protein [Betaproteobacteria bacterium 13_1_40CM_4_64_4]|nr:MAG: twin-arginine translocation pathway signal protein [Betaproteobacteria bacterium 13_1_40CM_4_64_4]